MVLGDRTGANLKALLNCKQNSVLTIAENFDKASAYFTV